MSTDPDAAPFPDMAARDISTALVQFLRRGGMEERGRGLRESEEHACLPPGKLVRPLLVLAAADLVGAAYDQVMPFAISVELAHTASLVHDDILDRDVLRRGRPSVWARFGAPQALLTGDALFFSMFESALEAKMEPSTVTQAIGLLARMGRDLCMGEVLQADAARSIDMSQQTYLEVVERKTVSLFRTCVELGSLPSRTGQERSSLRLFASSFGVAYQMQDDMIGLLSPPSVSGKTEHADEDGNVMSFPLIAVAFLDGAAAGRELVAALRSSDASAKEAARARVRESPKTMGFMRKEIDSYLARSAQSLSDLRDSAGKRYLQSLVDSCGARSI